MRIDNIKNVILEQIQQMNKDLDEVTDQLLSKDKQKGPDKDNQAVQKEIVTKSQEIYNNLTYELLRLMKLIISFGKYNIKIEQNEKQTQEKNKDFFSLLKYLVTILEFDKTYPESRKILIQARKGQQPPPWHYYCSPRYCSPRYCSRQYCSHQYCSPWYCSPWYCSRQPGGPALDFSSSFVSPRAAMRNIWPGCA